MVSREGEPANLSCPKCRTSILAQFTMQETIVDRCPSCDGIWFDAHELTHLLAEDARQVAALRRGSVKQEIAGKTGFCPRDGSELLRVYSAIDNSVVLDACAECRGIWLDGGEFQKLFAASQP